MAIYITTDNADALQKEIEKKIKEYEIRTWKIVKADGVNYITHSDKQKQWDNKAMLRPYIKGKDLVFGISNAEDTDGIDGMMYAVYHGKFIQMLLYHFDDMFTHAAATAFADKDYDAI